MFLLGLLTLLLLTILLVSGNSRTETDYSFSCESNSRNSRLWSISQSDSQSISSYIKLVEMRQNIQTFSLNAVIL